MKVPLSTEITIFVGDIFRDLRKRAQGFDPGASLITSRNYNRLLPGTYYVSLGDLENATQLISVLLQATTVVYSPPQSWSSIEMKGATENCFVKVSGIVPVCNFSPPVAKNLSAFLEIQDDRKSHQQQLWVAGCSIAAGVGIPSDERYGQLIANALELPVSFLAKSGSSIAWQADQILRSDIKSNDIIVWGLPATARFPYYIDNQIIHANKALNILDRIKNIVDIDIFDSDDLLYRNITSIYQVINFCKKINAKLVLANFRSLILSEYLNTHQEFINLANLPDLEFIDLGSDNSHPGKKQHKFYSDQLIKKIKMLYGELK